MMPVFEGQVSEDELKHLIAFIRSLDGSKPVAVEESVPVETEDLSKLTPVERGEKLYQAKLCATCHSLDGSKIVGPSFKGLYGRSEKLVGGSSVTVNDQYITESIKNPTAKVVDGYPPAMPQLGLTDGEIADLIAYLKTVK